MKERYTLHYCHRKNAPWMDMFFVRWEELSFKTLREAKEYLPLAGDGAYIIDNVTNKRIQ